MIVIPGDIRVQAAKPEFLEQMSLPQIADIVVNAAAFAPVRYRPHIAGEDGEQCETTENLEIFHRFDRTALSEVQNIQA